MKLIANLVQVLGTGAFSALIMRWFGAANYVVVGALVVASCGLLLIRVEREALALCQANGLWLAVSSIIFTSIVFGVIWPAIPLIFAWGAVWDDDPNPARDDVN